MKRENYIDIAKGIATILVIIGHCSYTYVPVSVWLYTFHMPLFFIINGFFISGGVQRSSFKEFTKKKAKTLLISYLILAIPIYISKIVTQTLKTGTINLKLMLNHFLGIFIAWRNHPLDIGMWFIPALFVTDILAYPILKTIFNTKKIKEKNKTLFTLVIAFISFTIGISITKIVKKGLIWSLDLVPVCIAFVLIGHVLSNINKDENIFSNKNLMIIMLALNITFGFLNYLVCGKSDMNFLNLGNGVYYITSAVSGSIFILQISKLIGKNKILETIGKRSLTYYALQGTIALPIAHIIVVKFFNFINFENRFIEWILIIVLCITILDILSRILEKLMPKIFKRDFKQEMKKN